MGYVAHYQQFDPEATHAGPPASGDAPTDQFAAWPPPGPGRHHPVAGRHEASPPPDGPDPDHDETHDQYAASPEQYAAHTDQYAVHPDQFAAHPDQYPGYADQYQAFSERRAYPDRYGTYLDQYQEAYPPADDATAVFARPDDRLIDLSAPRPAPVEHRRPGRMRTGVLALAALAVMLAGGTGYALLRGTGSDNAAAASARPSTDASPSPSVPPGDTAAPNGEPVHTAPASPAATTTPPPATVAVSAAPTVITVVPAPATAQPVRTVAPAPSIAPTTATPAPTGTSASPSVTPLTAAYSYRTDDDDADPVTGYLGTIQVTNPGDTAAGPWTIRLAVPSGTTATVETGDITTTYDGNTVTFHAGTIAAHGSTTFTFTLSDPLDALPTTCTINGTACD